MILNVDRKDIFTVSRVKTGFIVDTNDAAYAYSNGDDLLDGLREILGVPAENGNAQGGFVPVRTAVDGVETTAHGPIYPVDAEPAAEKPAMELEAFAVKEPEPKPVDEPKVEAPKQEIDGVWELAGYINSKGGETAWVKVPFTELETVLRASVATVHKWIRQARDENLIRVYRVFKGENTGNWFSTHPDHGGKAPEYEAWAGIELKYEPEEKPAETAKPAASEKPSAPAKPTEMTADASLIMDELRNRVSMFGKFSFKMKLSALSDLTEVKLRDIPGILELLQSRGMIGFSPSSGGTYAFTVKEKETA